LSDLIPIVVEYGASVSADSFESILAEALAPKGKLLKEPQHIVLDFTETDFIDIVSCQYITAFELTARSRNWLVSLRPPSNKAVRDFWRHWEFPQAFKAATELDFASLFSGEDRKILTEAQTTYSYRAPLRVEEPEDSDTASSRHFFGFVSEALKEVDASNLAHFEAERWTIPEVQQILKQHLDRGSDYLPSRVVFEAFFNAAKHPNAKLIQTASWNKHLTKRVNGKEIRDNGFFNFIFWDDGESIEDTMCNAVRSGVPVREDYSSEFDRKFHFVYEDVENDSNSYSSGLFSRCSLNNETPREVVFASCIFPGVTSQPDSMVQSVAQELRDYDYRLAQRGMGLYALFSAIVEVLDGEVSFRCGQYFMNIRKLGPIESKELDAQFQIKLVKQPSHLPIFFGNMIWVRLHPKHAEDAMQ